MFVPIWAPFLWPWFVMAAMIDKSTGGKISKPIDDFMKDDVRRQFSPDRTGVKSDPY